MKGAVLACTTAFVTATGAALPHVEGDVLRYVTLVLAAAAVLLAARNAQAATATPPSWWIADALCVHDGWHYTTGWQHGHPSYRLYGHSYWRTAWTGTWGEGSWTYNAGPQYGGLQLDGQFELDYGAAFVRRWGNAGNWPVWAQIVTAWHGWLSQGWGAWPMTSRACGLR